jgi:proteasome lid subunit RPN8/RPN11
MPRLIAVGCASLTHLTGDEIVPERTRLSGDDIQFDEIRYREPVRLRRPDRDRQWACVAYEIPGPDDLPIFLDRASADAIERHALRDTSVELGGILLGKECVDDQTGTPFVWVTKSLEAKHYENTQASFTYTHDSWEEITRERDKLYPDLDIVGWYHTHPDFGIFLSSHDLFIQHNFFGQKLQVAYVVDPIRQTRGFFQWRKSAMAQVGGFFLIADRAERVALVRLVNDLENIPTSDGTGVGGALSPRLEAELIAMLTRPATHHHVPAADRALNQLLFTLLGTMIGVVLFAAVFWLNSMHGALQDQAKAIDELRKTVSESNDRQRVVFDAAIGDPGGTSTDRLMRATRERDEAKRKAENQVSISEQLENRNKQLAADFKTLQKKYDEASAFAKDAKEVSRLRTENQEYQVAHEQSLRQVKDLEVLLDTTEGRKVQQLSTNYGRAWYAAAIGWGLSGLLLLALVGGYTYLRFPLEDDAPMENSTGTHRIT